MESQGSEKHIFTYGAKTCLCLGMESAAENHFDKKNFRLPLLQEKNPVLWGHPFTATMQKQKEPESEHSAHFT